MSSRWIVGWSAKLPKVCCDSAATGSLRAVAVIINQSTSNLRATLKLLEDGNEDDEQPALGRGESKENQNPKDKEKKPRTAGQELKSMINKASNKLTESKGWVKKLTQNGV